MLNLKRSIIAFAGLLLLAAALPTMIPLVSQGQGNSQQPSLSVRDADNPARNPFSRGATLVLGDGSAFTHVDIFTVPAGKRLVVQDAGVIALVPSGQKVAVRLAKFVSGVHRNIRPLTLTFEHTDAGLIPPFDHFEASESLVMYFEPGEILAAIFSRSSQSGSAAAGVTVTGYLINLP